MGAPPASPIPLLRALHSGDKGAVQTWLAKDSADVNRLIEVLQRNELSGYLFTLVKDAGLESLVGVDTEKRLASAYQRQERHCHRLLSLLDELHTRLDTAEIPFLLMKGFAQSVRFNGGAFRRWMWDQDILVRPQDVGPAIAAAAEVGLTAAPGINLDAGRLMRWSNAIELRDGKRKLDLHWSLRNQRGICITYADVVDRAQPVRLMDKEYSSLGDLDTLRVAALGLATDIERSHIKLRKIWDLYLILLRLDEATDWPAWFRQQRQNRIDKTILNVLSFCLLALGATDECPRVQGELRRYRNELLIQRRETVDAILARGRQSLRNRLLMSRIQPVSAFHYWIWWLGTLPFRFWVGRQM